MTEPVGATELRPPEQDASTRFHHDLIIQALVDQSPIGIQVFAADGRSIATNHTLRMMLGLPGDVGAGPRSRSPCTGARIAARGSGWTCPGS